MITFILANSLEATLLARVMERVSLTISAKMGGGTGRKGFKLLKSVLVTYLPGLTSSIHCRWSWALPSFECDVLKQCRHVLWHTCLCLGKGEGLSMSL
ncbi:unnamed protein product [Choristocarpus tenellus]